MPSPFANRMLAWLVSKKDSYAVKQACASGGLVGRTPPPVCKHTAPMVNEAVSIRLIICMPSCKNDTEAVKQAGTRLRTVGGGWGGAAPPHLQTQCSHGWFHKKIHMLSSKLAQAGVGGAQPPPLANILLAW